MDFSFEDYILTFFRSKDEIVLCKTCESVLHLMDHRYCCKKMLTPVVLTSLLGILKNPNIKFSPLKETVLKVLYNFLRRDGKTPRMIMQYNGLDVLVKLFSAETAVSKGSLVMLLNILYTLAVCDSVKTKMLDRLFYTLLLELFSGGEDDIALAALTILSQFLDDHLAKEYFLEYEGPSLVLNKILDTANDELQNNCLVFMLRIIQYKKIGMAFLKIGSTAALSSIRGKMKRPYNIMPQLLDNMYNLYLPKKFYELGKLDITDKLRNRFYVIAGKSTGPFPFLEIIEDTQVCTRAIIYVVHFRGGASTKFECPCEIATAVSSTSVQGTPSKQNLVKKNSTSSNASELKYPLKVAYQTPVKIRYGKVTDDPYLMDYANQLKGKLYCDSGNVYCLRRRIELLAEFVHSCLAGFKPGTHIANLHISTLKEKLGTSMIPIGFVRVGGYCEKALLFKALADQLGIPATLNKGTGNVYWNEVAVPAECDGSNVSCLTFSVVDLMVDIGRLLVIDSEAANNYCNVNNRGKEENVELEECCCK